MMMVMMTTTIIIYIYWLYCHPHPPASVAQKGQRGDLRTLQRGRGDVHLGAWTLPGAPAARAARGGGP